MEEARAIEARLDRETARPVPREIEAVARAAAARYPNGAIEAILYYGSCFRDGKIEGGLVDLYLLARDAEAVHKNALMRFWAKAFPPNVYYIETLFEGRTVRAKYALLPLDQFEAKVQAGIRNPYFWARFAQPTGIVFANDLDRIRKALADAVTTLTNHARQLSPAHTEDERFWTAILGQTYRTELRVEKPHRTRQIYAADAERYNQIRTLAPLATPSQAPWPLRRIEGRLLSIARLIKAAYTFQGGPDYLVWKIQRHTGVQLELSEWQKKHPLLAAWPILWRLWRQKTVR